MNFRVLMREINPLTPDLICGFYSAHGSLRKKSCACVCVCVCVCVRVCMLSKFAHTCTNGGCVKGDESATHLPSGWPWLNGRYKRG